MYTFLPLPAKKRKNNNESLDQRRALVEEVPDSNLILAIRKDLYINELFVIRATLFTLLNILGENGKREK